MASSVRERARSFIEKERCGLTLYKKFHSISQSKDRSIREQLGDFIDLRFSLLHDLSLIYFYPMSIYELYRTGTLLGYCSILDMEIKLHDAGLLEKSDLFEIAPNEDFRSIQLEFWKSRKLGIPSLSGMDRDRKTLSYHLNEIPFRPVIKLLDNSCCFHFLGMMNGQLQPLSEYYCNSKEQESCNFTVFLMTDKERTVFHPLEKENLLKAIDSLVNSLMSKKKTVTRPELGDTIHISTDQAVNYALLSISKGHYVLSKWAGRKLGEKIAEKASQTSLLTVLDFAKDLFLKLGVGIIGTEMSQESITITLEESVYSAGVDNIDTKLCAFISGIFNGFLNKSAGTKWIVRETKCIANGDETCEFVCTTENPDTLGRLLLG